MEDNKYYDDHYKKMVIQPIELMQYLLSPEEFRGYLKGNIIKYTLRAGLKEGEPFEKDKTKLERYSNWLSLNKLGLKIDPRI